MEPRPATKRRREPELPDSAPEVRDPDLRPDGVRREPPDDTPPDSLPPRDEERPVET
jgi:hypothetical protein